MRVQKLLKSLLIIALMGAAFAPVLVAQDKMEMIEELRTLQIDLADKQVSKRDEAEKAILKMGPFVLDHLELPEDATSDLRDRIARIRKALEKEAVASVSKPSLVTLQGAMTVAEALAAIKTQTQNNVVIANPQLSDTKVDVDFKDAGFWEVLDSILDQSGLVVDTYGGEPGLLSLTSSELLGNPGQVTASAKKTAVPVDYSKIFRVSVSRMDSSINLAQPNMDYSNMTLLVRWEPRLRPISVNMPMSNVKIVDEFGDEIKVANAEEVAYGMIQPELPELEFSLQLPRVDRQVETLKTFKARIDALLPGRVETFRFKKLANQKVGRQISMAGATVTYGGVKKNGDVHMVKLSLSFDEENNALESHQGWVFQNEVFLVNDDGEREEYIGMETLQQDNSKVTVRYLFLNEPKLRTLVYKTPAAIVKLPVDIELKKIPLP